MSHQRWMRRCLELAARAEGRTSPNPMVGCVIVDGKGELVAEGYHRKAGGPHAEVVALRKAGKRARGATMYVSLEPCNHHGRTPPCAPQVAAAGIRTLVYAVGDPIEGHDGGGAWLRSQGVRCISGVLAEEARELNRGFFSVAERGRPFVTVKAAMSLDGKIATRTGESQWITSEEARRQGHELRGRLDAIVVGIGTVKADDPRLTARGARRARDPVRVVLDSKLRTPASARLLPANSESSARCIIATTRGAPEAAERRLRARGAEVWRLPARRQRVRVAALMVRLAKEGVRTVLVEGGGEVIASALDEDVVDELRLFVAPTVIGGPAPAWVGGAGAKTLDKAHEFRYFGAASRVGPDLAVVLRRAGEGPA